MQILSICKTECTETINVMANGRPRFLRVVVKGANRLYAIAGMGNRYEIAF